MNNDSFFNFENILLMPVLHGSFEFALEVRRRFKQEKFDAIAVEFPRTLSTHIIQAVSRLPEISVILYKEKSGETVYLVIEPVDPLVEAVRLGLENGVAVYFIDRDVENYVPRRDPYPDSYAVSRIGYEEYVRRCVEADIGESDELDTLRELTMAYNLQRIRSKHERVFAVYGLAHHQGILSRLSIPQPVPLERTRRDGIIIANLEPDSLREVLSEPPFLAVVYELVRGTPLPAPEKSAKVIESASRFRKDSNETVATSREHFEPSGNLVKQFRENSVTEDGGTKKPAIPEWSYPCSTDRQELYFRLVEGARHFHKINSGEDVSNYQIAVMFQYLRNLAMLKSRLIAEFMDLLVAARGVAGDNFAYEVWDLGTAYPWQKTSSPYLNLKITPEDLRLGSRKITFHRTFKTLRTRFSPFSLKRRPKERFPGEWKESFEPGQICSFQPEDIVIEDFGRYLRRKGISSLSEDRARVEPFTTSILDGIDMRETIRNWHEKKIYVREIRKVQGGVGSVVIIFDPDNKGPIERYPQRITWLGEHEQESDMAFYSTPMGEKMVGPGIARCEYGGLMMTYPPLRLPDIWKDPYYEQAGARSKAEILLWAGIEYSLDKYIVYVAPEAPRSFFQSLAGALGKKVIYLPIGTFSPRTLSKIRVFHILSGKSTREYAHRYIW